MVIVVLAMLCAQSVAAQVVSGVTVYAWTDKVQYKLGETGKLKITVLNERDAPVEIQSITIEYPWFAYNGETGEWEGNDTVTEGLPMWVDPGEVFYAEVGFTVPTDGRVAQPFGAGTIDIDVWMEQGRASEDVTLWVASASAPISIENFDTWMTSLTVALVVCTIILAIVVLLATRRTRAPRALVPRAPAPRPPPKPKAKTG